MNLDFSAIWNLIDKGGTLALAILAIVSFVRAWVIPAWAYNDLKTRCDKTSELAERATELAERTATAANVLIEEIRNLQKQRESESAEKLLAELKEMHLKVTMTQRAVVLPPAEEGEKKS